MNKSVIREIHNLQSKIKQIKLLAFDSDGVLSDGGVYIFSNGEEFRRFDIKDGMGLAQCLKAGYEVAVISGSPSLHVKFRAARLGIQHVFLGVADKLECLQVLCGSLDITLDQVVFMGDDLADLSIMRAVGFACAPADAATEIKQAAHYVCQHPGGHGAVREVCDMILVGLEGHG